MESINLTPREIFVAVPVSELEHHKLKPDSDHFVIKNHNMMIKHTGWYNGQKLDSAMIEKVLIPIAAIPLSEEELRKVFEAGESRTVSFEGFIDIYNNTPKEKEV